MGQNIVTYILTSDKLVNSTIQMVDTFYKKYHPKSDVCVLGYSNPKVKPLFCRFESLGEDQGVDKVCQQLYEYFSKKEEKYFIIEVDDKPIVKSFNYEILDFLIEKIKNDKIGRIGLTPDNNNRKHKIIEEHKNFSINETLKGENHFLSITMSLWDKDYFLKYLPQCNNLWEWETLKINDEWRVCCTTPTVTDYIHIFKRGKILPNWWVSTNTRKSISNEEKYNLSYIYNI